MYQHYMYLDGVFFEVTSASNEENIIATGFRMIWGCILYCNIQQRNPLITINQVLKNIILGVKLFAGTKILNHRNFDHQYHLIFRCYLIRS